MLNFLKIEPALPKNKEELEQYIWFYPFPFAMFVPDDYQKICKKIVETYNIYSDRFDFVEYIVPENQAIMGMEKKVHFRLQRKNKQYEKFFTVIWKNGTINLKSSTLIYFKKEENGN